MDEINNSTGPTIPKESKTPFTVSLSLQNTCYDLPVKDFLHSFPLVTNPLASAAVFSHSHDPNQPDARPRLLLLQRAPTDTLPLKWELPGGSVDMGHQDGSGDASVIAAAVRELREETGLVAKRVLREVDVQTEFYEEVPGRKEGPLVWRQFIFEVEVEAEAVAVAVRLDPEEHARYLWCTEDEIRAAKSEQGEGVELEFTNLDAQGVMVRAFALHRKGKT